MNEFSKKSRQLTPELYRSFKTALELGKWPDGNPLSREQKSLVLEAIIIYENRHLQEQDRTGYIADQCRSAGGDSAEGQAGAGDNAGTKPIKWQ